MGTIGERDIIIFICRKIFRKRERERDGLVYVGGAGEILQLLTGQTETGTRTEKHLLEVERTGDNREEGRPAHGE